MERARSSTRNWGANDVTRGCVVDTSLPSMKPLQLVHLRHRELGETHNPCNRPQVGRDDVARIFLAVAFNDHPCLVHPVHAAEVGTGQEMRPGTQEQLGSPSTGACGTVMRDLDQEPIHRASSEDRLRYGSECTRYPCQAS